MKDLSRTQRRGILHLLYKKDDPLSLKNWRPISLLNLDYKIATKALYNRLRKVLPQILSEDQTCGMPGRSIFENLLLRDTIDYAKLKQLSAAVISLDQEKAFDRVNHAFLKHVLERYFLWLSMTAGCPQLFLSSEGLGKIARSPLCYIAWLSKP